MQVIAKTYHNDSTGSAEIYVLDSGLEVVIWSTGEKYFWAGSYLANKKIEKEALEAIKKWDKPSRNHRQEMARIELDFALEKQT